MYNTQEIEASNHLLQAQIFGAIDGKRSIDVIGQLLSKIYNIPINICANAVKRI